MYKNEIALGKLHDACKLIMNRKLPLECFREAQKKDGRRPLILLRANGTRWSSRTGSWIRSDDLMDYIVIVLQKSKWTQEDVKHFLKEQMESLLEQDNYEVIKILDEFDQLAPEIRLISDDEEDTEYSDEISDDLFTFDVKEQEFIHNMRIGFIDFIHPYVAKFQLHRYSLLEWCFDYKMIRIQAVKVQKWSDDLEFVGKLQIKFHKEAKTDIQEIWLVFLKIMDKRGSQFNDKLLCIGESLLPWSIGLGHSFDDWKDVMEAFLGISDEPSNDQDRNEQLCDLGPRFVARLSDFTSRDSPGTPPSIKFVRESLGNEWKKYLDRSTWVGNYKGSYCPLKFWSSKVIRTIFPFLGLLALHLLQVEVTIASVERSMKALASIVTEKRNRLGLEKVNEEMLIKFNADSSIKNHNRLERLEKVYDGFCSAYEKMNIMINDEKEIIQKIDTLHDPMKIIALQQDTPSLSPETRTSRKTKVFEMIETNPDYLPKKRSTRQSMSSSIVGDDDDDDDDYEN